MAWLVRRSARSDPKGEVNSALRAALLALLVGEQQQAENQITRAVNVDSNAIDAYLALGRLYRKRGQVGRAIRVHQNMLLRNDLDESERITALAELARDLEQGGFVRRAIASYEEVLVHDANHPEALEALVELLPQVRDYSRAIAMNRRLARRNRHRSAPVEARLLTRMAEAAHSEGQHQSARSVVKRALRKNPREGQALLLLGQLESERGRSKAALSAWRKAAQIGGAGTGAVYELLETAFASLDRAREYPDFLRQLLDQRPDDAGLGLALARTLSERGEVEPAVAELRRLLDRDSGNLELRAALGRLLLSEHRNTDALKEYGELLEVLLRSRDRERTQELP
jgi:lipopolysaccharide biosynthesis regulator YciM